MFAISRLKFVRIADAVADYDDQTPSGGVRLPKWQFSAFVLISLPFSSLDCRCRKLFAVSFPVAFKLISFLRFRFIVCVFIGNILERVDDYVDKSLCLFLFGWTGRQMFSSTWSSPSSPQDHLISNQRVCFKKTPIRLYVSCHHSPTIRPSV